MHIGKVIELTPQGDDKHQDRLWFVPPRIVQLVAKVFLDRVLYGVAFREAW
jgi:hypothetical protein